MSGRLDTSSPREKIITLRASFGSLMFSPVPRPRDSFHLRRDSSLASVVYFSISKVCGGERGVGGDFVLVGLGCACFMWLSLVIWASSTFIPNLLYSSIVFFSPTCVWREHGQCTKDICRLSSASHLETLGVLGLELVWLRNTSYARHDCKEVVILEK